MREENSINRSCPNEEVLAAYSDNLLEKDTLESIEEHLADCDRCLGVVESLYKFKKSLLEDTLDTPSEEIVSKAKALVSDKSPSLVTRIVEWFQEFFTFPAFATVAIASVVCVVSIPIIFNQILRSPEALPIINLSVVSLGTMGSTVRSEDETKESRDIQEGEILYSGEYFAVKVNLNEDAYVYLILHDSIGKVDFLLSAYYSIEKASQDLTLQVPYPLDTNVGNEELFLVATKQEIINIEEKINELNNAGIKNIYSTFPNSSIKTFWFKHENLLKSE